MTNSVDTDATDEVEILLKSERRRLFRERIGSTTMVAGVVVCALTQALGQTGAVAQAGLAYGWWTGTVLVLIGALVAIVWQRGRAARRLEALIGRRDRLQRRRNTVLYGSSVSGWAMIAVSLPALWRISQGEWDAGGVGFVVGAALAPWLLVLGVAGWNGLWFLNRQWLEDEVTRDIRRRALSFGFLILSTLMTALFMLSLWRPDLAIMAFPAALMTASSAAGLRFVWLDQQAEGGEGG